MRSDLSHDDRRVRITWDRFSECYRELGECLRIERIPRQGTCEEISDALERAACPEVGMAGESSPILTRCVVKNSFDRAACGFALLLEPADIRGELFTA